MLNDAHCHFFSSQFFRTLGRKVTDLKGDAAIELPSRLSWIAPGTDDQLADQWIAALDHHGVTRAVLIASVPGDEASVSAAVARHPQRFVGAFMFNPAAPDADTAIERAFQTPHLRMACLFPAMHSFSLAATELDPIYQAISTQPGAVLFAHCGVLSVGIRQKLGLPSRFDMRFSNPIDLHATALRYPHLKCVIPHFGAGYFREALILAGLCPNVYLDTSSSNSWMKYEDLNLVTQKLYTGET